MPSQMLDLSKLRFLIVDDSANMRSIVKYLLRALGVQIMKEAADGAEAFRVLKNYNPDIIITNWMMSPLDGVEFTKLLRTADDSPNPMVPIIMISGHTESARVNQARDAGITEFLAKPISPNSLYLRIAEVILRPRRFVRSKSYFGPDRHRRNDEFFDGEPKRKSDFKEADKRQDSDVKLTETQDSGK